MRIQYLAVILLSLIITSCKTRQPAQYTSLSRCQYEPDTKTTSFTYLGDFGYTIEIPGQWRHIGFDQNSRDNVFSDSLDQKLFIFKGSRGVSSFNKSNLDCNEFIRLFYDWDSKWYLDNSPGLEAKVITNSPGKYLVAEYADDAAERTALYGTKYGNGVRITIVSKVDKNPQTDFVVNLYNNLK
ncbi:MAG: hypothetical protein V4643_09880 [Bacteroidota bacterium]